MLDTMMMRLGQWNARMNDIPRKCALIAMTLLCAWVMIAVLPYCWPFVLALLFSMLLEPIVRWLTKLTQRFRLGRGVAAAAVVVLFFGLVGVLIYLLVRRLTGELVGLAQSAPQLIAWVNDVLVPQIRELYARYQDVLPPYLVTGLESLVSELGSTALSLAKSVSSAVTSGAWRTATSIPGALLSVVLTVMGTFYMTVDRARIRAFFTRTFPSVVREQSLRIKTRLFFSLFGQVKSQLLVSLIGAIFLTTAFVLYGVPYGLLLGLMIGVADALPVIGAGLFLIPGSILSFILGDTGMGIFLACAYIGIIVIRQIAEPRIVGHNLGLYPLATMIAMFAGFQMFKFWGLILGPVLLSMMKAVLEADANARKLAMAEAGGAAPAEAPPKPEAAPPVDAATQDAAPKRRERPIRKRS